MENNTLASPLTISVPCTGYFSALPSTPNSILYSPGRTHSVPSSSTNDKTCGGTDRLTVRDSPGETSRKRSKLKSSFLGELKCWLERKPSTTTSLVTLPVFVTLTEYTAGECSVPAL